MHLVLVMRVWVVARARIRMLFDVAGIRMLFDVAGVRVFFVVAGIRVLFDVAGVRAIAARAAEAIGCACEIDRREVIGAHAHVLRGAEASIARGLAGDLFVRAGVRLGVMIARVVAGMIARVIAWVITGRPTAAAVVIAGGRWMIAVATVDRTLGRRRIARYAAGRCDDRRCESAEDAACHAVMDR